MCVQLDPSINAAKAVPSVTLDFRATPSIGWVAVSGSGCSGSNEVLIEIGDLGKRIKGGNPYAGPAAFYLLVP